MLVRSSLRTDQCAPRYCGMLITFFPMNCRLQPTLHHGITNFKNALWCKRKHSLNSLETFRKKEKGVKGIFFSFLLKKICCLQDVFKAMFLCARPVACEVQLCVGSKALPYSRVHSEKQGKIQFIGSLSIGR